ncbi:MAG: protein translocase subunit SecF [Oscillospiraceae bacterium]|nr:protein translocase subunit SecF [Oscillospiraceae bacterium]
MIQFIKYRKIYFAISAVFMLFVLIFALVFGVNMDIQFKGGSMVTYSYAGEMDVDAFAKAVESAAGRATVQKTQDVASGTNSVIVSLSGTKSLTAEQQSAMTEALEAQFPENQLAVVQVNNVDPTIGKEFFAKCMVAVAFSALLMVIYIAFRFRRIGGWSAGVMCVVALIHDVIMVFATFLLCGISLNDNFIAVALTILGYSINDTIVIYDRIRENRKLMGDDVPVGELVNASINQTLNRTIMTAVTTVLAMTVVCIVAYVYNVTSIISFALPMIVGMLAGVYSSICVAPQLWVVWQEHKAKKLAR